ncbi:TRAP transporter large permease [Rhabdaerophilum calidifontis]|uniref:TRAP transporter large permease n=1 Tax=Rhabdaerophilum calidifontis TaxID=2604328 RepID=UPI00123A634D|nr:TRAP transporter large permease [Rhabdaerophilum calidifontis]
MSNNLFALLGFAGMLVLIALRMPVAMAMLVTGAAGYAGFVGLPVFLNYIKTTPYYLFSNYTLSVIPLFVLMGAFAERSGLSNGLFRAMSGLVGHLRGGMGMAVIGSCTAFGAICGSSVATTATFGRAALPELEADGYRPGIAAGTIAVGGTLGILIPPSVILVVYAISTEQNIVKLFMAALVPGLLAALFYVAVIGWLARRDPAGMPVQPALPWGERLRRLGAVWPSLLIAFVVVGGIYGGVFTPTEAAAVGAVAVLVDGVVRRALPWGAFVEALRQSAETCGMIFMILLGAEVFNAFLALTQLPTNAAEWITGFGLPPYLVLAALLAFYVLLGAVMDELAMILLTLPVFFPIVTALDFGMSTDEVAIWFGILVLIVVGIGLVAPPIGLNVFVIAAIARRIPVTDIYRGVLPFVGADLARLLLVVLFPSLALWLVRLLS